MKEKKKKKKKKKGGRLFLGERMGERGDCGASIYWGKEKKKGGS